MLSLSSEDSPDGGQRRERAAVAAQACETCRTRKSRCDEQRPKCGLCHRLNVDCVYREPLPTKKDKTMVQILETLNRLESKFDTMNRKGLLTPSLSTSGALGGGSVSHSSSSSHRGSSQGVQTQDAGVTSSQITITMPHKALLWPSIYILIINSGSPAAADLDNLLQGGTPWFIEREMANSQDRLPTGIGLQSLALPGASLGSDRPTRVKFPQLDAQQAQEYCQAYFTAFNITHPILDRDTFNKDIMAPIMRNGFADGDFASVIALLVLALGQVAVVGLSGAPVSNVSGVPSGIRGGSLEYPPGLELFNEARRRLGFIATVISLENIQVMLLQATYYGTCARHLDYWRSTVAASMAVQVLVRCQMTDLKKFRSPYGDLVKRAYWTCVLSEDLFHLDLDLPVTGVVNLQDTVPLPYAGDYEEAPNTESRSIADQSYFPHHFLAMIALRRHIMNISAVVDVASTSAHAYGGPPHIMLQEVARQLENWRSTLPEALQWQDGQRMDFPNPETPGHRSKERLFSATSGPLPITHNFNLDIVTAQLRTRYYFAKYMLYRPFIFKAIHFAELMSAEDRWHCAQALQAALLWPMSLAPPKDKKRLVPHLFTWTSNFVSMLLVLRMTRQGGCLQEICEEYVSAEDANKSIMLMLEWIRDVRQLCAIAEWGWKILEPLYFGKSDE